VYQNFDAWFFVPLLQKLDKAIAMYILIVRLCEMYLYFHSGVEDLQSLLGEAQRVLAILLDEREPDHKNEGPVQTAIVSALRSALDRCIPVAKVIPGFLQNLVVTLDGDRLQNQGTWDAASMECRLRNQQPGLQNGDKRTLNTLLPQRNLQDGTPYALRPPGDYYNAPNELRSMRRYICALVYMFNRYYAEYDAFRHDDARVIWPHILTLGDMVDVIYSRLGVVFKNQRTAAGGVYGWSQKWKDVGKYTVPPDYKNWPRTLLRTGTNLSRSYRYGVGPFMDGRGGSS
jgi:hypothetical protein